MNRRVKLWQVIKQNITRSDVGAQAAQLAFYILLSLAPMLLVLSHLITFLPIQYNRIIEYLSTVLPEAVLKILEPVLNNYFYHGNNGYLSLGVILSLWSASQTFVSLQHVLNKIYMAKPRKNVIVTRLFSFLVALLFVIGIASIIFLFVFGGHILRLLQQFSLIREGVAIVFDNLKWLVALSVLFVAMVIIYYVVPNVRWKIKYALPGAVFTTLGIVLVSQLYSVYISFAQRQALAEGTIGIFVILILWLYVIAMLMLLGAWINVIYYDYKVMPGLKKERYRKETTQFTYYSEHYQDIAEDAIFIQKSQE